MIQKTKINLKLNLNLRFYGLLIIIILSFKLSIGQEFSTDTTLLTDSVQVSDSIDPVDSEFNFIMFNFFYTNNKIKAKGDSPDENLPAFISDISFLHKTGINTELVFTNYLSADSFSYDLDLQIGYQKSFLKDYIDIDFNYMYHKYSGVNDFEGIKYNHALNLSTGLTYKMLYLYGGGNFYLDNENYFTDFGLTISLDFEKLLFKNDFLFILPTVSANFGTDYWLYDIYAPYIDNYLIPLLRYRGYQVDNLTTEDVVERYLENQGLSTNTFSYQGVDFLIPVTFGINSFSASFSWMYYIPSDKLKAFGMKDQSGYIISFSFIF